MEDRDRFTDEINGRIVKELIKNWLENNKDEAISIVKNYLLHYLEDVMDNPDKMLKDALEDKDKRIAELEKRVEALENGMSVTGLESDYRNRYDGTDDIRRNVLEDILRSTERFGREDDDSGPRLRNIEDD